MKGNTKRTYARTTQTEKITYPRKEHMHAQLRQIKERIKEKNICTHNLDREKNVSKKRTYARTTQTYKRTYKRKEHMHAQLRQRKERIKEKNICTHNLDG